ncbi:MAG: radical SAM protein [Candidatus Omnitrophota bacterium]|nr:radical SAM protein [Candidatus Omnitrophota bacterium]
MENNIQRLELHISYDCVNNCIFCSEHKQLIKFKGYFLPKSVVNNVLEKYHKGRINHVTFTGGEPTFHPDFVEIVKLAKTKGYKTYTTSNGGLFYLKDFTREALNYVDEFCFSLHGHSAKLHNFHTNNEHSFDNLLRALKNIDRHPKDIFGIVNIVLTRYNFGSLDRIIKFISNFKKIKQILISNIAPEGNALDNFCELSVPLKLIKENIRTIISEADRNSLVVRFFGIPLCILNNYQGCSNDLWWSPRTTIEKMHRSSQRFLKVTHSYRPVRGRIYTVVCQRCAKKNICGGIFKRYYKEFGDKELSPI